MSRSEFYHWFTLSTDHKYGSLEIFYVDKKTGKQDSFSLTVRDEELYKIIEKIKKEQGKSINPNNYHREVQQEKLTLKVGLHFSKELRKKLRKPEEIEACDRTIKDFEESIQTIRLKYLMDEW